MKTSKHFLVFLLCIICITPVLFPKQAGAYSYGDPNMEEVAEVYKKTVAELNETPPDFAGAKTSFESIKPELDMHMGPQPSEVVLGSINSKNKDKVIADFQKILVLNIARRLESIEKGFQDYKQNKMLIAKANATYEALSPQVKQKDAALDTTLRQSFEKSLEALGNPGLFGVGVKEPDLAAFQANKQQILSELQAQFKLESLEVGHFAEGDKPAETKTREGRGAVDVSDLKNWLPLAAIVIVLAGVVLYARKKRKG